MRNIKLLLFVVPFILYSCSSSSSIIKTLEIEQQENENITTLNNQTLTNPITINGIWRETNYEEEFGHKKRDYLVYVKDQSTILGFYVKENNTSRRYSARNVFFSTSISNQVKRLEKDGIIFELKTTDNENYQLYKYKGMDNISFYGLIGVLQKHIWFVSVYNNNLTDSQKEALLIELFSDIKS